MPPRRAGQVAPARPPVAVLVPRPAATPAAEVVGPLAPPQAEPQARRWVALPAPEWEAAQASRVTPRWMRPPAPPTLPTRPPRTGVAAGSAMGGAAGSGMGGSSGVPSDAAMDAPPVDANLADTAAVETGGGEAGLPGPAARGQDL